MSFGEIGIIMIVALLVIRPEDIPAVLKKLRSLYKYFLSLKKEIEKELKNITDDEAVEEENQRINFYLKKIMELNESYEGDYSLADVKAFYHKLILQKRISSKK